MRFTVFIRYGKGHRRQAEQHAERFRDTRQHGPRSLQHIENHGDDEPNTYKSCYHTQRRYEKTDTMANVVEYTLSLNDWITGKLNKINITNNRA